MALMGCGTFAGDICVLIVFFEWIDMVPWVVIMVRVVILSVCQH